MTAVLSAMFFYVCVVIVQAYGHNSHMKHRSLEEVKSPPPPEQNKFSVSLLLQYMSKP